MRRFLPVPNATHCYGCGVAVAPSPTDGYSRQALVANDDPGASEARVYCSNRCINADAEDLSATWDAQCETFLATAQVVEDETSRGLRETVYVTVPFRPTARYSPIVKETKNVNINDAMVATIQEMATSPFYAEQLGRLLSCASMNNLSLRSQMGINAREALGDETLWDSFTGGWTSAQLEYSA
jgi:hypothetical protein